MKSSRKGQAALEYLVTYGWAILAIVVVVAVLWYLGVFNPSQWQVQGPQALGFARFNVLDQQFSATDGLTLVLGNSVGSNVQITSAVYTPNGAASQTCTLGSAVSISSGAKGNLVMSAATCTEAVAFDCGTSGDAFEGKLVISATNTASGLAFTDAGTLKGKCA